MDGADALAADLAADVAHVGVDGARPGAVGVAPHLDEELLPRAHDVGSGGQEGDLFRKELRRAFADVQEVRPEGKRATSKEFYWVAAGSRMRAENAGS